MSDDTTTERPRPRDAAGRPEDSRRPSPDRSLRNFGIAFFAISAVVVILAFVVEAAAG